ncbi:hypothetical protein BCR42DRAFT_387667 [Absidia repens]|uniref:Uncharacterized protein n=1 Tax=Absidia repens TaxID=90262 RepID=A0A1X2IVM6_9FUNG|nr:hypothetical protein BCR42DRAFT_387667 [Absidia repens]
MCIYFVKHREDFESLFDVATASAIPGPEFPVPIAQAWLDLSRLVNDQPLPPHVTEFVHGFSVIFGIMVLIQELRTDYQCATGCMYNSPSFTLAHVIGGQMTYYQHRYCDQFPTAQEEDSDGDNDLQ